MEIFKERYSGREYDPKRQVPKEAVTAIIDAAHLSPSCYNEQPWHYIIADKKDQPDAYQKIFDTLVEFNQGWVENVPLLIVSVCSTKYRKNGKPDRHGPYDTGAATFAMMLEATHLGLMAHQMGGFDEKKLSKSFNIPEDYIPMAVMALGYEKEGAEPVPKDRRPKEKHFFIGEWGNP